MKCEEEKLSSSVFSLLVFHHLQGQTLRTEYFEKYAKNVESTHVMYFIKEFAVHVICIAFF